MSKSRVAFGRSVGLSIPKLAREPTDGWMYGGREEASRRRLEAEKAAGWVGGRGRTALSRLTRRGWRGSIFNRESNH